MKTHLIAFAALLAVGCGANSPVQELSAPSSIAAPTPTPIAHFSARDFVALQCGDTTYVGPIRLPISVHGTTVYLSWLGNDNATRGYELEFQRYDVSNTWLFAMHDVVTSPEAKEHLRTEGTYRVRVRGLFCGADGPFTDWQVFSTDDTEDHSITPPPIIIPPPPVIIPPCLEDCDNDPPPPPSCQPNEHLVDGNCVHNGDGDGNGNGQGDDHGHGGGNNNPPPPPPVDPPTLFCHVTTHTEGRDHHIVFDYHELTLPLSAIYNGHIPQHQYDTLGACPN